MGVAFDILAARGIVHVRYWGHACVAETERALEAYASHPDARPGQTHLVDLARVESFERDFVRLMRMQAEKAVMFMQEGEDALVVYYAPGEVARQMAEVIRRSWEGLERISLRVLTTEADCLDVLGQPERSFAALREAADIA